jgi:hypothetical protein
MISDFLSQLWTKKDREIVEKKTKQGDNSSSAAPEELSTPSNRPRSRRGHGSFRSEFSFNQSNRCLGNVPVPLDGEVEALLKAKKRGNIYVKTATRSNIKDYKPKNVDKTPSQIETIGKRDTYLFMFRLLL